MLYCVYIQHLVVCHWDKISTLSVSTLLTIYTSAPPNGRGPMFFYAQNAIFSLFFSSLAINFKHNINSIWSKSHKNNLYFYFLFSTINTFNDSAVCPIDKLMLIHTLDNLNLGGCFNFTVNHVYTGCIHVATVSNGNNVYSDRTNDIQTLCLLKVEIV